MNKIRYDEHNDKKCSYFCKFKPASKNRQCKKFKVKLGSVAYMTSPYSGGRDYYRSTKCLKLVGERW